MSAEQLHNYASQWLSLRLGETWVVLNSNEIAFIAPGLEANHKESGEVAGRLQYAGRTFSVYRMNGNFELIGDFDPEKGSGASEFCVCLASAQQSPFVLVVDELKQQEIRNLSSVTPLPTVMQSLGGPITHVAEAEGGLVLLSSTERIFSYLLRQLHPNQKAVRT